MKKLSAVLDAREVLPKQRSERLFCHVMCLEILYILKIIVRCAKPKNLTSHNLDQNTWVAMLMRH
ncbi:hypothetical protein FDE64_15445 [Vibrio parahaemolyticus]|nr:hypothetical protein [Vibrio parahaemolyticus]